MSFARSVSFGVIFGSFCFVLSSAAGTVYTWSPAGSDLLMSNPANWGESAVDLTSGEQTLKFDQVTVDNSPVLNQNVSVYALQFGNLLSTSGYFRMTRPDGTDWALTLGAGGVVHSNNRRYHMVSVPVVINGDQTWNVNGQQLFFTGPLSDADPAHPATIKVTGSGVLGLQSKDSTFAGTLDVASGMSVWCSYHHPLGPDAKVKLTSTAAVVLSNSAVVPSAIEINGCSPEYGNIRIDNRGGIGDGVITGEVSYASTADTQRLFYLLNDSTTAKIQLTLGGGVKGSGNVRFWFSKSDSVKVTTKPAEIVITNKPWVTTGKVRSMQGVLRDDGSYGRIVFSVASNEFAALGYNTDGLRWAGSDIKTTVDWAFDKDDMPLYFGNWSTFDLCGTKQRIGTLTMNAAGANYPVTVGNSADAPATLYVKQALDYTMDGDFAGKLNLVLSGDRTMTINRPSAATGSLEVSGKLAFTATGSWTNATHLTIADGGLVTTVSSTTFSSNVFLAVTGTGKWNLGCDAAVMRATLDGKPLAKGRYNKTGTGAAACTFLEGDGVLTVRYSSVLDITDGTLSVPAGESVLLDDGVMCSEPFSRVVLGDGATLTVTDTTFMPVKGTYVFEVGAGATISLPTGVEYFCSSVTLAGVAQSGWVAFGDGRVYADGATTDHVWTCAKDGNLYLDHEANWDTLPDLANGTSNLKFENVDPDYDPLLPANVFVKKLTLGYVTYKAGGYHQFLRPAGTDYGLTIGPGGIAHTNVNGRFHMIGVPVYALGDQTWSFSGANSYLGIDAPLHDYWPNRPATIAIRVDGNVFSIQGTNGTFSGTLDVQQGTLKFDNRNTTSGDATVRVASNACVQIYGATVSAGFDIRCKDRGWAGDYRVYMEGGGTRGEVSGPVTYEANGGQCYPFGIRTYKSSASTLVLSGGVTGSGDARFGMSPNNVPYAACHLGTLLVTNKPWKSTGKLKSLGNQRSVLTPEGRYARMILAVPGNEFKALGYDSDGYAWAYCDVVTTVDWAFDQPEMTTYLGIGTQFDLCGTKQRIGTLVMNSADASTAAAYVAVTNSSETEATLYVNQTERDCTQKGDFGGKLNLDISGTKTMTINRPSAATGWIAVHGSARLVLAEGGTWRNLTDLTVTDSATVTVSDPQAFGNSMTGVVQLASWDSLSLGSGVVKNVEELRVGGTRQRGGVYVFGSGTLNVKTRGFVLYVR